jgi:catecholate siderophore receptor
MDASRMPIAGAKITARQSERGSPSVGTQTGPAGGFTLSLTPGRWTVSAAADGFQDGEIEVDAGDAALAEIMLQVEARNDSVTVVETVNYQVVTSSALKTPTPILNLPQSVAVVSLDLIRDQSMQNMADVVRYVPGITMAQGEGHRDAPVIRGNATTADFYVNGVRDDVQYFRDLYNVERVEAVKGANALTFGRGGGGGVINRVIKEPVLMPLREVTVQAGAFNTKRGTVDFEQPVNDQVSFRLNGMYENSGSFRDYVNVERYGVAPSALFRLNDRTQLKAAYERFDDGRVVDRGIPSWNGRPAPVERSTFFGSPDANHSSAGVHLGSLTLEHQADFAHIRNATVIGDYDKYYGNLVPGAVSADGTMVSFSGYDNSTARRNFFNQTDVTATVHTGSLRHTILTGSEIGRQWTNNFRNTAFFDNSDATTISMPLADPVVRSPFSFRQKPTDADNHVVAQVASAYLQDQVEVTRWLQVVGGVRYDYFGLNFRNNRNGERLSRPDHMLSPRLGLILKPAASVSLYSSYSVAYLPSSGDQFSSLTATTQTLRPEKFTNYEAGLKWDVRRYLSFTSAVYRLDRSNTTARDPNDPAQIVQTGSQRSTGLELAVNGNLMRHWRVIGGYSWQDAYVRSATTAAASGAKVPLVPHHSFSLWNNYRLLPRLSGGLGLVHQASMFTGIDNTVRLPGFTRADAAVFYTLHENMRLQANVENLTDERYFPTAHSNNNILPGYARTVRVCLIARF